MPHLPAHHLLLLQHLQLRWNHHQVCFEFSNSKFESKFELTFIRIFYLLSGTSQSSSSSATTTTTNNEATSTTTTTNNTTTTKKTTTKRGNKDLEAKLPTSAAYELVQASQALQAVQALQVGCNDIICIQIKALLFESNMFTENSSFP